MAAVIFLLNACGWAIFVFTVMPHNFHYAKLGVGLGVAVTAWTLGLRHAFDDLDPETAQVEDLADLRAIAEAAERARRDEALLTERVALARAHRRSWNRIAAALGVSRQAARQRFGGKVGA